ncbi:MAG: CxxCxxCC domain-containing protein [Planctomycetota bacterium]|jgi:uncharacterized cysteine cluster protein YcgN (CxxCxxCC family)
MSEDKDICRKCGKCCYEKIIADDDVIFTSVPCKFLDEENNLCKVYENRHDAHIRCLTIEEGIKARAFPADCPYVKDVKGYQEPVELEDTTAVNKFVEE